MKLKKERYDIIKELIELDYWNIDIEKGTVTPKKTKRVPIKLKADDEYDAIRVNYQGKQIRFYVHQIIAIAGGLNPVDMTIQHKNGDIHDNSIFNLKVVEDYQYSIKKIISNRILTGMTLTCEEHPNAVLSNEDVAYIKYRLQHNTTGFLLSEIYNVNPRTISCIKRNRTWKKIEAFHEAEARNYEQSERGKALGLST